LSYGIAPKSVIRGETRIIMWAPLFCLFSLYFLFIQDAGNDIREVWE